MQYITSVHYPTDEHFVLNGKCVLSGEVDFGTLFVIVPAWIGQVIHK